MNKFNVGDVIKRTHKLSHGNVVEGGEYTVSNVGASGRLQLDGDTLYIYDDEGFELVKGVGLSDNTMNTTKEILMSKFKVGDTVRRTGEACHDIVHGGIYTVERLIGTYAIALCESTSTKGYDLDLFEAAPSGNTTNTTKENLMYKFKVGDIVVMSTGVNSAYLKHSVEYTVSKVLAHKVSVVGIDYEYDWDVFTVVRKSTGLTDKEVFNAIIDGKPLQYQFGEKPEWYDLKYPEKLTLLDVQRGTYRVRPTDVKLECTVPYPAKSVGRVYSNKVRMFSVDLGTGEIRDFGEADLHSGGVFWSSREQAEQFRDAVLASLQGK